MKNTIEQISDWILDAMPIGARVVSLDYFEPDPDDSTIGAHVLIELSTSHLAMVEVEEGIREQIEEELTAATEAVLALTSMVGLLCRTPMLSEARH